MDRRNKRPASGANGHSHGPRPVPVTHPSAVQRAAALFRAIGDGARLALLDRLAGGEHCVTELAEATGEGLSTISERLKVLRAEGLVARRRDGKHIYYALADGHVADLIRSALEHVTEHGRR